MPEETNNTPQQLLTAILVQDVSLNDLGREEDSKIKDLVDKARTRQHKSLKNKNVSEELLRMVVKL